jgi:starch synthase
MRIWIAAMEFAGIAEAGGVKNVARSLTEEFDRCGEKTTVFIPRFGCTSFDEICEFKERAYPPAEIPFSDTVEIINYSFARITGTGIRVIFIENQHFAEKFGVYTYTAEEEEKNPSHKKGTGHTDMLLLDALFQRAVALFGADISEKDAPDIIHCHDAPAAVIPLYISRTGFSAFNDAKCVVTIHNAGPAYHHDFSSIGEAENYTGLPRSILCGAMNGSRVEPFLLSAVGRAALTTVSEQYASELLDPLHDRDSDGLAEIFRRRSIHITGITNGIDFERYNPEHPDKSLLPFPFSPLTGSLDGKYRCRDFFLSHFASETEASIHAESVRYLSGVARSGYLLSCSSRKQPVYFAYHGRLAEQKGILVLEDGISELLEQYDNIRFIIIGQGDTSLENGIVSLSEKYKGKIVFFKGYNRAMARLSVAISDFIILPSIFEPCGLEDFIAQIYGTIPIAHATGGLKKIISGKTGFLYSPDTASALFQKTSGLIDLKMSDSSCFNSLISYSASYVRDTYSWHKTAVERYLPFFRSLLKTY